MIPPTPTPFPTPNPTANPFSMPSVNLWQFADDAVQTWNMAPANTIQLVQVIFLMLLVLFGLFAVITFARRLTNHGESESAE